MEFTNPIAYDLVLQRIPRIAHISCCKVLVASFLGRLLTDTPISLLASKGPRKITSLGACCICWELPEDLCKKDPCNLNLAPLMSKKGWSTHAQLMGLLGLSGNFPDCAKGKASPSLQLDTWLAHLGSSLRELPWKRKLLPAPSLAW